MAESARNANRRLENIRSIQPLVEALRTISLAKWRSTLNRIQYLENFQEKLMDVYREIPKSFEGKNAKKRNNKDRFEWIFLIGSQRGFCGNFNQRLLRKLQEELSSKSPEHFRLYVYGNKIMQTLEKSGIPFSPFPIPFQIEQIGRKTVTEILDLEHFSREEHEISMLYNRYKVAGRYETAIETIYPFDESKNPKGDVSFENRYIFDTNPFKLNTYLDHELLIIRMMKSFFSAAASEYSTRFQIMENAVENADELVEDLEIQVLMERRKKITREMRELAVGAGLLEKK